MRSHSFWMAVYLIGAGYEPAVAQDAEPNLLDRCQTAPQTDSQASQDDQSGKSAPRSLTEMLNPCDGVLKPPATGDQEITQPPPATGEMPVIRPDQLPQQPPASE